MRFSLRALLAVTCVAAAVCCLYFVVPNVVAIPVIILLMILAPAALTAGIVYGRRYQRAFCIGGLTSCSWVPFYFGLMALILSQNSVSEWDAFVTQLDDLILALKILLMVEYIFVLAAGMLAVAVRRWLLRNGQKSSSPSDRFGRDLEKLPTIAIEPRDKAELYAILQGQISAAPTELGSP
ncbi:MAG TPA: hypothetical protein VGJ15_02355 [Pirellulales bacterium]|jgi:hypothetical protein